MIVIVDYGMGNLNSVLKAFQRLGVESCISSGTGDICDADKLILPGIGNFKKGMANLRELGLFDVLNKKVMEDKTPILGICLGMQLFTTHSEEGDEKGFGWFDARSIKFSFPESHPLIRIPHMGWNSIRIARDNPIFSGIEDDASFYFVHSYHVVCNNKEDILATTEYGFEVTSSIQKGNIFATQFHPEKSHRNGLKILDNFCRFTGK